MLLRTSSIVDFQQCLKSALLSRYLQYIQTIQRSEIITTYHGIMLEYDMYNGSNIFHSKASSESTIYHYHVAMKKLPFHFITFREVTCGAPLTYIPPLSFRCMSAIKKDKTLPNTCRYRPLHALFFQSFRPIIWPPF